MQIWDGVVVYICVIKKKQESGGHNFKISDLKYVGGLDGGSWQGGLIGHIS